MTDVMYTYAQTQKERKMEANGARGKKGSRGPKSCKLPHEYLTRKELNAMNGPVSTWDLKKFYNWDEFKKMPTDIQIQYVNRLTGNYDVSFSAICRHVFDVNVKAFDAYVRKHGLKPYLNKTTRSPKNEQRLIGAIATEAFVDQILDKSEKPKEEASKVITEQKTILSHASFEMNRFDRDFMDILEKRFGSQNIRVSITVEVIE